jgi:acetyl esterase/lipase
MLLLDLHYPEKKLSRKYPLVIYTHGGGWAAGSKENAHSGKKGMAVRALTDKGFCVAALSYRLCKKGTNVVIKDCVTDAKDAIRYLSKHGDELFLDVERLFVFGDSAGGQLAQMLLLSSPESFPGAEELIGVEYKIVAGVSWYGPCDFEKTELVNPDGRPNFRDRFGSRVIQTGTSPADKLRLYREVSAVNYLKQESPPLLMIQGDQDTTIPVHHAYYMKKKAEVVGAPVEILIVKNAGHNWREVGAKIEPSVDVIIQRTVDFMVSHLPK